MSEFLCITVRFLQPHSHGRGDNGEPEWPPSPLRMFQALVAAAAARWNERLRVEYAGPALEWLAGLPAPVVVAAAGVVSDAKRRTFVPDNTGDLAAGAWSRGDVARIVKRTEKDVRPTHLAGDAVHYLYPIASAADVALHRTVLTDAARSITHLGWGVDMVAGNAAVMSDEDVAQLVGESWRPTPDRTGVLSRVPQAGTLKALMDKHTAFLDRLSADGFRPVPPLTAFDVIGYRRDTDLAERAVVAFELRTTDFERFQPYDPARRTPDVAGMVRHAVGELATRMRPFGWTDEDIAGFVHGHAPNSSDRARGEVADRRFSYLPLPSIERRPNGSHVGAIRRILVTAPAEYRDAVLWTRVLSGHELSPLPGTPPAALRLIDRPGRTLSDDPNLRPYLGEARVWSTVTPVVLPGHDDPHGSRRRLRERDPARALSDEAKKNRLAELVDRARGLLEKAFRHSGFSEEVIRSLELEWRDVGFRAGVELASRYQLPVHLNGPRYHVRVRFAHPVRGPLVIGAGRYRGLGTFAAEE